MHIDYSSIANLLIISSLLLIIFDFFARKCYNNSKVKRFIKQFH